MRSDITNPSLSSIDKVRKSINDNTPGLALDDTMLEVVESENKPEIDTSKYTKIEDLKISIRDLNKDDILKRELPKNTKGVVITEISDESPLMFVSVSDVIVELQKKKIISSKQFSDLVKEIIDSDEKTLYLAIYNSNNQRSYITVKLK